MAWIGVALALIAPLSVSSIPQRLAAEQLETKRATITYCGGLILDDGHLYSIDEFGHWKQQFVSGVFIDIFLPVVAVKMHKNATDDDVKLLLEMPYLRELCLWDNDFSDKALLQLKDLRQIRRLEFRTVNYSQETVDTLRRALPNAKINED